MNLLRKSVVCVLCFALFISTSASAANPANDPAQGASSQDANLSAKELDDLVAPIALYPDTLVAQILGAATYPDQITAADEWVKSNSNLKDQALMEAVDKQPWDPSVKALTQFPSVLENLAKNLSWTSALGEASYYQQKDVTAAIQRLRKEAKSAGNLKSGEQIKVVQQDPQTIVIQPTNPQVVYVPQYNPTVVYGTPYNPPGYSSGDVAAAAIISFGVGMAVGAAINNSCCGWGYGYGGWGMGWHGGTVMYQRNVYVSRSAVYGGGYRGGYRGGYYGARPAAYNRGNVNSGNINNRQAINSGNRQTNIGSVNINTGGNTNVNRQNANVNRQNANTRAATNTSSREAWKNSGGGAMSSNVGGQRAASNTADRGYGQRTAANSGALGGYNKGGNVRSEASRGRSSFGGGGAGGHMGGGRRR